MGIVGRYIEGMLHGIDNNCYLLDCHASFVDRICDYSILILYCSHLSCHIEKSSLRIEEQFLVVTDGYIHFTSPDSWRKLHNAELHNLYSSPSLIRVTKSRGMRLAGHVARMGRKRNTHRVVVGKPQGKRPLRRPRRRWVDNIKMDLR
jgi:hypothetical protein